MRLQMKERVDRGGGGRPCQQRDGRACVQTSRGALWSGEHRRHIILSPKKNTMIYLQKTITATALAKHEIVASRKALQIREATLSKKCSFFEHCSKGL